jgi:hypothetical protein
LFGSPGLKKSLCTQESISSHRWSRHRVAKSKFLTSAMFTSLREYKYFGFIKLEVVGHNTVVMKVRIKVLMNTTSSLVPRRTDSNLCTG